MRLGPEALSAYDHVLRSEVLFLRFTRDDNAEARRLAEMAVEIDPKSAQAHAQLGLTHCMDHGCGWVGDRARALDAALGLARHAVQLDEANCRARWLLGFVHNFRREYDDARAHLRRRSPSIPTTARWRKRTRTWRRFGMEEKFGTVGSAVEMAQRSRTQRSRTQRSLTNTKSAKDTR
ncbi:MAG: hypothetical protein HC857_13805 [Synechococcales cyanobacterium RU_4_20]|nr:hypothetical protein [Synechococcales cyanobacterium RU_4_20]